MRDRIAQDRKDAGGAVDHRTVPATRLTTPLIISCELVVGGAVAGEVGAERIADLRLSLVAPGVLAQHVHLVFATQLGHSGAVMARHGEDQVGRP